LLQIADILLGKMLFNRMQHKPGEGDKRQYCGQADKKVSRRASEKVVWTVCYASGISSM
jgi:hypothetical protein